MDHDPIRINRQTYDQVAADFAARGVTCGMLALARRAGFGIS